MNQMIQFFRDIPFFHGLSDKNLEIVMDHFETKNNYKLNEILFREGDPSDGMYIIMYGKAVVEIRGERVAELSNNHFFGELALIDSEEKRSATVRISEVPFAALFLSKNTFHAITENIWEYVYNEIARRIIENQDHKRFGNI